MAVPRIPLDLYLEVTAPDGSRHKWDANQSAGSRPRNFRFGTKIGEGFSDSGLQLARRIDQDYTDLQLVNDITAYGADGSTAYEGRISSMPRELSDRHSVSVTAAGYMAHTKDRKFAEIYVDSGSANWGDPPLAEKARLLTGGLDIAQISTQRDGSGLTFALPNSALGSQVYASSWYTAPSGVTIALVAYKGTQTSVPVGWAAAAVAPSATDSYDGSTASTLTLDNTIRYTAISPAKRYVFLETYSNGTAATPASGANRTFTKLAVYGSHGLPFHTGDSTEPDGVYASDVVRDIVGRFCPLLNTDGVQDTSYVIQQLAFNRTFPYDALLELNKYHLWHLGVWDNRTLHFRPYDLTDYDWEIRTDDPGTTFNPQGPSTDSLFNGIAVTYTNLLTDVVETLTPDVYSEIADTSTTNPWNKWGTPHWDEVELRTPALTAQALDLGRAALADRNRPKTPGTITVRGYIRDRGGNPQPCWKVRAGQTIRITNFPNDSPRLIVETDYDDESKTISLSIDRPFALLDAYLDRVGNALGARGLV